jgi:hypothetical protein
MGCVVNSTPRPSTHCVGGWVGPRADLYRCGKSRLHWDSCSCVHMYEYILHVCTCVRMYLCMYVLTYVCVVRMYLHMYVLIFHMYARVYVRMYVCIWRDPAEFNSESWMSRVFTSHYNKTCKAAHQDFDFPLRVGKIMYTARTAVNQPLTGKNGRRRGRCVDHQLLRPDRDCEGWRMDVLRKNQ